MLDRRMCGILAIAVLQVAALSLSAQAGESEPNAAELVRAVRRAEMWLHDCDSLHIRVRGRWTKTPEWIAKRRAEIKEEYGIDDPDVIRFPGLRETSELSMEIAVDRKRVRYLTDDPGYWRQLKVWDGNELRIHEKYYHHPQEHYHLESKIPERMFSELFACHYNWPRSQPHSFWYAPCDVNEAMDFYGAPERFAFIGREVYRHVPCYVLEYRWSGKPARNRTWMWYVGQSNGRLYGIRALYAGRPTTEYWWSDYRQVVPGGWFPMKSSWCFYDEDEKGQAQLRSMCNLDVVEFHINEPLGEELFCVTIEPGVKVQDMRSGKLEIYKLSPTLLGKPIGPLDAIDLPAPLPPKGKPLLIVFIDFEQRPSRHGLKALLEHLDGSALDGVELVVIEASPMSSETLTAWREKLSVPFEIGVITGDAEAVRRSWGATSLPWLILTDADHIVRAEGFSPDELDEKI